jgi:sugar transferase (PEP-CTERM/EpsH1 system associated)
MNILFLVHRIPYPPIKGDKIRSFNELKYLSKENNMYLAFLIDDKRDLAYLDELGKYCIGLDYDTIAPHFQKIRTLPNLITGKPLSVQYFYSKKLQEAIDSRLSESRIDIIICFSSPMAEYIFRSKFNHLSTPNANPRPKDPNQANKPDRPDRQKGKNAIKRIKLIMDFVDVDSDKWLQYSKFARFPYSWIYDLEASRLAKYEQKVAEIFDHSLFVSQNEVDLFKRRNPHIKNVSAISNGVDLEYFNSNLCDSLQILMDGNKNERQQSISHHQPVLLFTGAMDYFANIDGVTWFANQVFPLIKKQIPGIKFYIVGSRPNKKVKALGGNNGIFVTGFVDDTREYLAKATVFVAPLRIARGIQNKILEAMAMGIPVVTTPQALQGIQAKIGKDLLVEEDPEGFACAVVRLIQDDRLREYLRNNGKNLLESKYSWEKNLQILEKTILPIKE